MTGADFYNILKGNIITKDLKLPQEYKYTL